jgi:hypothetical protein
MTGEKLWIAECTVECTDYRVIKAKTAREAEKLAEMGDYEYAVDYSIGGVRCVDAIEPYNEAAKAAVAKRIKRKERRGKR